MTSGICSDPIKELERRKKLSDSNRRRRYSKKTREKMSIFQRNKTVSDITRERMRKSQKGKIKSQTHRDNISKSLKNRHLTEKHRLNIKLSEMGEKNHFYGKCHSEKSIMKEVESKVGGFWYGNVKYPKHRHRKKYNHKFTDDDDENVRAFRNYTCFLCGYVWQPGERRLSNHHVHNDDPNPRIGKPKDAVPLCRKCHGKTGGKKKNRNYYETYLTDMIYALDPEGKCMYTKEEWKKIKSNAV